MSILRVIVGSLDECEKKINKLEEDGLVVNVVNARSLIETEHLFGSGTDHQIHQIPQVKMWQMLLQYKHKTR